MKIDVKEMSEEDLTVLLKRLVEKGLENVTHKDTYITFEF